MSGLVPWVRGQGGYPMGPPYSTLARVPQEANLTTPTSPSLRDWWRELREVSPVETPSPVQSAVVGIRQNAEGAVVGALLALIDTDLGGLDLGGRIPLDWVGSALFYVLSIQDAGRHDSLSLDYRAMGQSCTSVAMYRTIHKWRESKKDIPQNIPQTVGDPVLRAGASKF
jgi:hypothetical protein